MAEIDPAFLERERLRFTRPDAQRFVRPDWRRYVAPASPLGALYERYERKYSPDQPRVPPGQREGGQWTSDGGSVVTATPGVIRSDANPDPIRPGARYAAEIVIKPSAITADPKIDSTTVKLTTVLGHVMDVVGPTPGLTSQEFGRMVHEKFADTVRVLGLPGIGYDDVETTFGGAYYGADGSVRTDVVLRDDEGRVIAIYDVKTGDATISPARAAELRIKVGVDNTVPVFQLKGLQVDRKGLAWRAAADLQSRLWCFQKVFLR